ncbi:MULTISPECIES: MarR family winged helix-turn-helix transcriptional regulator [unclassified Arthrobacter]|uniref:MarR family winged helix-turn-helix transcriptional regulator n=1 Tax=unclassified Arthrobacter TaxID=235627 RepID=UPI000CE40FE0|nr:MULTISPECIES: MarR family transcriptional regulator [unclassified Arthrobacter]
MESTEAANKQLPPSIYDVDASDPASQLVDRSAMDPADVRQIGSVMAALGRLREAEQLLSDASLKYMKLNQTDMRALHYLIVAANTGGVTTPGGIAAHLKISTASTTKLLDRLERAGHITRSPHPSDRRALAIAITDVTRESAMNTVGRQQAKRFYSAARLNPAEREVVIRFLDDMAEQLSIKNLTWAQPEATEG